MPTLEMGHDNAMAEELLVGLKLDVVFDENELVFDLREGVILNATKTRLCILSTDLLSGIYKALSDEAGPAWKFIFKNCGRLWGARVARRLDREYQILTGRRLGDMPLDQFLVFATNYFVFHGWGTLTLKIDRARETGILEAELVDSVFAEVIPSTETMVEPMISGILASLLSYMSGQALDCVQTECSSQGKGPSRFIITSAERQKTVDDQVAMGVTHQKLMETI